MYNYIYNYMASKQKKFQQALLLGGIKNLGGRGNDAGYIGQV